MLNDKKAVLLRKIYDRLYRHYGELDCPLLHDNAFQLLIAVLLSAQCKDDRVNMVTPVLFGKYPTPEAMSQATAENGEIVVAIVHEDEAATVKRFFQRDGKIVLHPENEELSDMIFEPGQVSILGKVVGLMRNYRS